MATRGQRWAYWLETALDERGWSRAEIAKRSATKPNGRPVIDPSRVSEWLNKNEAPRDPEILHEIARVLGVRVSVVLVAAGWLPDEEIDVPSQTASLDANIADVAEAIRDDPDLIDEAREHLLRQYELLKRLSLPDPERRGGGSPQARLREDERLEDRRQRLRQEHTERARKGRDVQQDGGTKRGVAAGGHSGGGVGGGGRSVDR